MFSSLLQKAGLRPGLALHSSIPKVLMAAAILGGSGSMLSAGSANASVTCTFIAGVSSTCGPTLSLGDKVLTFVTLPTARPGSTGIITLADLGLDEYSVDVTFAPFLSALDGPVTSGVFEYDLDIIPTADKHFDSVQLTVNSPGSIPGSSIGAIIVKSEISTTPLFPTLTSNYGVSPVPAGFQSITGKPKSLKIRDSYSLTSATGGLTSFTNTFRQGTNDVPGPLPLMGAGMAFGFSRKLRSRIKASASAKV